MKKLKIYTHYTIEDQDFVEVVGYTASTSVLLDVNSIATGYDIHDEKLGKIERKIVKDYQEHLETKNA